jgi:hypothetical protein
MLEGQAVAGGNSPCVQAMVTDFGAMVRTMLAEMAGSPVAVAVRITVFPTGT